MSGAEHPTGLIPRSVLLTRMPNITLQVIDGADRGRSFVDLPTPVTIGREEGNTVQLNDERVSRFHLKIQEDHDQLILTDLESTNGTKVNGEDTHIRILRYGDMIALGRSVLVYGSPEQIAQRLRDLRTSAAEMGQTISPEALPEGAGAGEASSSLDFELNWGHAPGEHATLHNLEPPDLPARLTPGQAAQLTELLEYLHIRLRGLLEGVRVDDRRETVEIDQRQWQNLLDLQGRLAVYLRRISEPGE